MAKAKGQKAAKKAAKTRSVKDSAALPTEVPHGHTQGARAPHHRVTAVAGHHDVRPDKIPTPWTEKAR